ncbi:MAG: lamin tail domain-containing protein [Candidatus Kryptoniota bacterium]
MGAKLIFGRILVSFAILTALYSKSHADGVKISELMYAPSRGEPEWIELYNCSSDSVNLKGWMIGNKSKILYTLSVTDFYLHAWSYVVITRSAAIYSYHSEIPSPVMIVSSLPEYFLVNTGDTVSIRNSSGQLVDSMFYSHAWGGGNGKSLERISFNVSSLMQSNWSTSVDSSGSTPGKKNSLAQSEYDIQAVRLKAVVFGGDTVEFNLTLRNLGTREASGYSVDFFADTSDSGNSFIRAGTFHSIVELLSGDSLTIKFSTMCSSVSRLAKAIVNFPPDENIANNSVVTDIVHCYNERDIVINEIMYAPSRGESEWIELFNPTDRFINLKGFTVGDNSSAKAIISSTDYIASPSSYVIVAHDTSFFSAHLKVTGKVFVTALPQLNNTGDAVVIKDESGKTIDSVAYEPSWGGDRGGRSLERINATGSSSDRKNFGTCSDVEGSTPNKINSISPTDYDLSIGSISVAPQIIRAGDSAFVSFYIVNRGNKVASESMVKIFYDLNSNLSIDRGEEIDSQKVPSILPSDSVRVNFIVMLPSQGPTTLGVLVVSPEDQRVSNNVAFLTLKAGVRKQSVVVNELMYAPKNAEQEWIELYNADAIPIDMSGFRISTRSASVTIGAKIVLDPGDYLVICKDSTVARFHRPVKNLVLQAVPSLHNDGDVVLLYDNGGSLLDSVSYLPVMGGATGKSLERIDYLSSANGVNWAESVDSTGATPGSVNSVAILPYDISINSLQIMPKIVDANIAASVVATIGNVGRNKMASFSFVLRVFKVGETEVISESSGSSEIILNPGDSVQLSHQILLPVSGVYRCMLTIKNPLDMRARNDTLSSLLFVRYAPQTIVINEIMYSGRGEYFELYGNSSAPIDLTGWSYRVNGRQNSLITKTRKEIMPGGYFVITSDTALCEEIADSSIANLDRSLSLRDEGGSIVILDSSGGIIDSVYYMPSWHNSDITLTRGRSLEKINPLLPSNEKSSWSSSVSPSGGTPGKKNSIFVERLRTSSDLKIEPNPFSPDGDGYNDFTFISYSFNAPYVRMRVRIFDMMGRCIAVPVDNVVLPASGNVVWNGRDESGRLVRFGIYVMYIEVAGPDGSIFGTYKKQVVVAKKMR